MTDADQNRHSRGCDEPAILKGLISVDKAISTGISIATTVRECEDLSLFDAVGRVLADDLRTPMALPPFDNSGMDGYALRTTDLQGHGPWVLRVTQRIAAGDNISKLPPLEAGCTARIFTGAAVPNSADAIIMQEHVVRDGDLIILSKTVPKGDNIRRLGEDAKSGSFLLPAGILIGAREIGAIASIGMPTIKVRRKVRIGLLCTGSELRQPGQSLAPGQIYNSNRFMMRAAMSQPWSEVIDFGTVGDDPDRVCESLKAAASGNDLLVTTGGVSVGEEDHMLTQLRRAGGEVDVLKIAMKPGKPLTMGKLGDTVFVGLPGNPVAAFTTWKIIGSQVASKTAGLRMVDRRWPQVEVAHTATRRPGRQEFRPAQIIGVSKQGHPRIEFLDKSFSAKISLICKSDGFAVVPAHLEQISAGDQLQFVYL